VATPVPDRVAARAGRALIKALVVLSLLTAASWGLAHAPLGPLHGAVALAIAVLKASVVALVFMEVGHAPVPARTVGLVTLLFIVLLCAGVVADATTR
jgi:cytochrome c oxidase subunit IV